LTTHILDHLVHCATCFEGIQRWIHRLLLTRQTRNYIIPAAEEEILADRNHLGSAKIEEGGGGSVRSENQKG
jgi:hypothetical protein